MGISPFFPEYLKKIFVPTIYRNFTEITVMNAFHIFIIEAINNGKKGIWTIVFFIILFCENIMEEFHLKCQFEVDIYILSS